MKERWIDVKDNPEYEVSNLGNIRKKKNGRIIKWHLNKENGYPRVTINGKHDYVHRVVAKSFYDCDVTGLDVNHIDGDKENFALPNLEIVTRKENIQHAFDNGLKFASVVKVVRCKFCKHRYEMDTCMGKSDDFFCSYGER